MPIAVPAKNLELSQASEPRVKQTSPASRVSTTSIQPIAAGSSSLSAHQNCVPTRTQTPTQTATHTVTMQSVTTQRTNMVHSPSNIQQDKKKIPVAKKSLKRKVETQEQDPLSFQVTVQSGQRNVRRRLNRFDKKKTTSKPVSLKVNVHFEAGDSNISCASEFETENTAISYVEDPGPVFPGFDKIQSFPDTKAVYYHQRV